MIDVLLLIEAMRTARPAAQWAAGIALALLAGAGLYLGAAHTVDVEARARFDHLARTGRQQLAGAVHSYADVLRGLAGLFQASGTVTRLDRRTGEPLGAPIRVGANPRQLAFGFGSVWVTNRDDNTVTRIDARTGRVVGSPIPVGAAPLGIAAGAGAVWVSNHDSHTITRIQP